MSVPTGNDPYQDPVLGDLRAWYPAYVLYAATSAEGDQYFHGPHIAPPVDLDRVVKGLAQVDDKTILPTLEYLREELMKRAQHSNGQPLMDSGSPCHNFWHWLNGD